MILKDTEIYPSLLGGPDTTGEVIWKHTPWIPQLPNIFMYSLIAMGYHLEETVDHIFIEERSNDFLEMLLHHIATLTLYGGMLTNNALRIGVLIGWVHCIADVPISLSQLMS